MRKVIFYLEFGVVGALVWCVLFERFSIENLMIGFVFGIIASLFSDAFLMARESHKAYYFNPFIFLLFVFVLIYKIIVSGIKTIIPIILGKSSIISVRIRTKVDGGLMTSTIANAITLTPGTVTVEKKGNVLRVLWLDVHKRKEESARTTIEGSFEKILLKGYKVHD